MIIQNILCIVEVAKQGIVRLIARIRAMQDIYFDLQALVHEALNLQLMMQIQRLRQTIPPLPHLILAMYANMG